MEHSAVAWDAIEEMLAEQRRSFCNGLIELLIEARAVCREAGMSPFTLLVRHLRCDFGDIDDRTKIANRAAMVLIPCEIWLSRRLWGGGEAG